jgi:hypothetical protein
VLASIGVDRIVQQRIASLEQKAALEQQKRIRAEQQAAEEHRRRGDTADALFRAVVRRATGKDRP